MKIRYAAAAMAAIIVIQVILAVSFNWHTAEVFSSTAVSILFWYAICRLIAVQKKCSKAK